MSQTTPRAIAFKITALILVAYFALAALRYMNDARSIHWVLFYLICALCCLLTVLRKDSLPLLYAAIGMGITELAAVSDAWVILLRQGLENPDQSSLNLRRDFFGVLISIVVCACLAIRLRRATRK